MLLNFINSVDSVRFYITKRFRPHRSTSRARLFPIYIANIFDLYIIRYSICLAEECLEWGDLEFIESWADIVANLVNLIVVSWKRSELFPQHCSLFCCFGSPRKAIHLTCFFNDTSLLKMIHFVESYFEQSVIVSFCHIVDCLNLRAEEFWYQLRLYFTSM